MKWPDEPIMVTVRDNERGPFAKDCSYTNQQGYCDRNQDAWDLFLGWLVPPWREWFWDERAPEDRGPCPKPDDEEEEKPEPSPSPTKTKPPLPHPSPRSNHVSCWNFGDRFRRIDLTKNIASFCKHAVGSGAHLPPNYFLSRVQPVPDMFNTIKYVAFSLTVHGDYEADLSWDSCRRYLTAEVDSCQCSGVNRKQGGLLSNNCLNAGIWPGADKKDVVHDEL